MDTVGWEAVELIIKSIIDKEFNIIWLSMFGALLEKGTKARETVSSASVSDHACSFG